MLTRTFLTLAIISVGLASITVFEKEDVIGYDEIIKDFLGLEPVEDIKIQWIDESFDLKQISNDFTQGIEVLMKFYNQNDGVWIDPFCIKVGSCVLGNGWWYWGNAAHILADYEFYCPNCGTNYTLDFPNLFSKNLNQMTSAGYFDDEGWWGLAMIHIYRVTNNETYLDQAKRISDDMQNRGQQKICGNGGIFWDAAHTQVGAIANELFISLNAKIALLNDPDETYKNRAIDTWNWLENSGLIGSDNIILDHYNVNSGQTCGDLVSWTFTYTNGVILSGLADLAKLTGDNSYIAKANNIARAAINMFAPGGFVTDSYSNNDPSSLKEDGFLFKGIFVENLAYLAERTDDSQLQQQIKNLLVSNYNSLTTNQSPGKVYGYVWNETRGDNNSADIVTHLSGLYLIDSVIQLS